MKKLIIIISFLFFIIPVKAYEYGINNYYINAELKDNGDLYVEEYYEMNGEYNGSTNSILYANPNLVEFDNTISILGYSNIYDGNKIILNEIRGLQKGLSFDDDKHIGTLFKEDYNAYKGEYGVYTETNISKGKLYTIYMPSYRNEAFYISYTIKNIGVLHNDVGELWWKRFDTSNLNESIKHLEVRIKFPNNNNEFRVWAHGPLNGDVRKQDNNTLVAVIDGLNAHQDISFRSTFDKNVINKSNKKSNIDALDKILSYESDKANEANYQREIATKYYKGLFLEIVDSCSSNPNRSCYNTLINCIENITDDEFIKTYSKTLEKIHIDVNKLEEDEAHNLIKFAKDNPTYRNYIVAKTAVEKLENEEVKIDLINELSEVITIVRKKEKENAITISEIILFLVGLSLLIERSAKYLINKYGSSFNHEYYRDIPEISPTSISYLINKKINDKSISAEILNLIDKGVISYNKLSDKKDDYELILDESKKDTLDDKELYIVIFIFGNKKKVNLKDLKRRYNPYSRLKNIYNSAKKEAEDEMLLLETEKKEKTLLDKLFIISLIGLFVFPLIFMFVFPIVVIIKFVYGSFKENKIVKYFGNLILYINIVLILFVMFFIIAENHFYVLNVVLIALMGIIIIIILSRKIIKTTIKTNKGKEEYCKIMAFKKFLNDFSKMDEKELPEIKLWNKYLVYAVVLGCAKKLIKTMKLKLETIDTDVVITNVSDITFINSITTSALKSTYKEYARTYSSGSGGSIYGGYSGGVSFSSGSGGGGGFSSGSSGGGGGGGVGRF